MGTLYAIIDNQINLGVRNTKAERIRYLDISLSELKFAELLSISVNIFVPKEMHKETEPTNTTPIDRCIHINNHRNKKREDTKCFIIHFFLYFSQKES